MRSRCPDPPRRPALGRILLAVQRGEIDVAVAWGPFAGYFARRSGSDLADAKWIYGNDPAAIHATIALGRPNGMPTFRGKIHDPQIWRLVAYVRSMSGLAPLAPMDAAPGLMGMTRRVHTYARRAEIGR
jgi:hypothetical protein